MQTQSRQRVQVILDFMIYMISASRDGDFSAILVAGIESQELVPRCVHENVPTIE
jgi:hypothetical protein